MNALRRSWTLPLFLLLVVRGIAPLHAAEWLPVTTEELQLTSEPKAPGAVAIYLYRQVDRSDPSSEESHYVRLKILKEEGRKYADVEITYTKGESIRGIDARTIRPDGSIVKFDGSVYDKAVVSGRGVKVMAKTFTMPGAGVGSVIEYRYRREQSAAYVFDSHWVLSQELFTKYAKFSLTPSPDFNLRFTWPNGLPEGTASPARGEGGRIKLETHDVPAFVTEELMPPENELKYRVDFIYFDDAHFSKEPDTYWKLIGKDAFRDVEKFVDHRKAMERAVAEIVQPDDSPEARLRKIYARVQRMNNESYERKKTEEELKRAQKEEARSVEDVWARNSGTASQLNYMFIALARAAGVQASSALVGTRDEYFFNPGQMNAGQLNSNIVIATIAGQDWFLDPGVPFTPFGLLPWYETAVPALRLDAKGYKWIETPSPTPGDARIERTAQLKLEQGGTLAGKVTIRFTGMEGAWRRLEERNEDDTDRKQFLEEQLRDIVSSAIEVKLTNTPDWAAGEEPLVAEYELRVPGWVASAGQRQLLKLGLFGAEEDHTFQHQTRTQLIYFNFPYQYSDSIAIEMPAGKRIDSLPQPHNFDFKTYSYALTAEEKDGTLHLKRDISIALLLVKPKYYDLLRQFFQSVRTADEEQIVIAPVTAQR